MENQNNKISMDTFKAAISNNLPEVLSEAKILMIAKVCHEANRAYCESNGDNSQLRWANAEQWQRNSTIAGVKDRIENPSAGHGRSHTTWMESLLNDGWVYGPVKDSILKTNPSLVPFEELPQIQKDKDYLFCAIVDALK